MRPLFGIAFAILHMSGAGAWAQSKDCEVPPFRIVDGLTITGRMTVRAGKRCSIPIEPGAPGFLAARIVKHPTSGSAAVVGSDVVYTPRKDYVGGDQFVFFPDNANRSCDKVLLTIDIAVTVVP